MGIDQINTGVSDAVARFSGIQDSANDEYIGQLYALARMNGIPDWQLLLVQRYGCGSMELEEFIYNPELLERFVDEILCDEDHLSASRW